MILDDNAIKRLHEEIDPDSKYWLEPGDVLVQRANTIDYLGSTAVYRGLPNEFIYPDLMMRLRFSVIDLEDYIWRLFNYSQTRLFFRKNATGIAGSMPKISGTILKTTPVPLPSLAEIEQINRELDSKLTVLNQFEADCEVSIRQAESLRQSILKKAFSGQLVPQDPTDEPASKLLERIKSEKAEREVEAKAVKKSRKPKANKKTTTAKKR